MHHALLGAEESREAEVDDPDLGGDLGVREQHVLLRVRGRGRVRGKVRVEIRARVKVRVRVRVWVRGSKGRASGLRSRCTAPWACMYLTAPTMVRTCVRT